MFICEQAPTKLKCFLQRRIYSTILTVFVIDSPRLHLTFVAFCLLSVIRKQKLKQCNYSVVQSYSAYDRIPDRFYVIGMEFLSLSCRRSSSRNVPYKTYFRLSRDIKIIKRISRVNSSNNFMTEAKVLSPPFWSIFSFPRLSLDELLYSLTVLSKLYRERVPFSRPTS